jgi:subtilase family serine protease
MFAQLRLLSLFRNNMNRVLGLLIVCALFIVLANARQIRVFSHKRRTLSNSKLPSLAPKFSHSNKNPGTRSNPRDFKPARTLASETLPNGFSPAEVKSYYNFETSTTAGKGQTIALVVAYSNPYLLSDLAYFSQKFNLPTPNIRIVNQTGGSILPAVDASWVREITLDVQWAHAIAPGADILVVCATTGDLDNIYEATWYAAQNAKYVSMSWGSAEFESQSDFDAQFKKYTDAGVSFFAASGDFGANVNYPASSPSVIGVGGTTIKVDSNKVFTSEIAWFSSGGGCSVYAEAPIAQSSNAGYSTKSCASRRGVPDISLLADPQSGALIYHTYGCNATGVTTCWIVMGGTSLGSPIAAALAAVSGRSFTHQMVYSGGLSFRDVTSGSSYDSNGNYQNATVGYDLVTGVGSLLGQFSSATTMPSTTTVAATTTSTPASSTGITTVAGTTTTVVPGTTSAATTVSPTTITSSSPYTTTTFAPTSSSKCVILARGGVDKSIFRDK